jgi:ribose transport system substrate-binding protein
LRGWEHGDRTKAAHPKIRIVTVQYGGGDRHKASEIAKSILQSHPSVKRIFGANEGSAIGALEGAKGGGGYRG